MGPPGGGRTFITPRITRHFNLVSLTLFEDDTLNLIFSTILKTYMANNGFNPEVCKVESKVI
jgi:dynein heavy chain